MITAKQTAKLREIIGSKHNVKILMYFIDNDIVNRDGMPYSETFISKVFNGKVANPIIEKGIFDYVSELPEQREKEEKRRKEILSKAKKYSHDKG